MGLFIKKSVPVRFRGRNLQNVTAKITRRGIEPWEFQMNEQEEDLILNAIERNLGFQLGNANEIRRRIISRGNRGNAVEYNVIVQENDNNNNEEEEENNNNEEENNEYARWAGNHFLNRRGGSKKLRKTSKRRRKHKRHTKKH
jgi:hypothetical protein